MTRTNSMRCAERISLVKLFLYLGFTVRKAYTAYTFRFTSFQYFLQGFQLLKSPVYEESSCLL